MQAIFKQRTKELLQEEYDAFEKVLNTQPPVSIRFNPNKPDADMQRSQWTNNPSTIDEDLHISTVYIQEPVPWCETGFYLSERPSFTFDPLFHAGTYYVQEASSMFIEQAVRKIIKDNTETSGLASGEYTPTSVGKPVTALDLCAAPGGKSTHLQTLLPEGSLLVSNEVVRSRSMILAENMTKWGLPDNIVTNNDPKDFGRLTHLFDIILADLPCSGEGMFRKAPASRDEWSVDNVKLCASRQRRIIHDVWDALKPGGWLIYSTCTFNTEENEDNITTLAGELGAEIVPIPIKEEWNIAGALCHDIPVCRFLPHRTKGEGFFIALLQKNNGATGAVKLKYKNKQSAIIPEKIKNMLSKPEKFLFLANERPIQQNASETKHHTKNSRNTSSSIYAINKTHENVLHILSEHLRIISAGISIGELKGKDFIPSVSLAMSTEINREAFPSIELSYKDSIKYLQKEIITIPEETPTGYILVKYKNTPLGFIKNIGNRTNNLYPQEWRIRKVKN